MAVFSSADQRAILSLSFEPAKSGYTYYRNRWSRGIPVTAEEREMYLRIPAFGSRRTWLRSISGRETLPPRQYGPVALKLLASMPSAMIVPAAFVGMTGTLSGLAEGDPVLSSLYLAGGGVSLLFGAAILVGHVIQSKTDAR